MASGAEPRGTNQPARRKAGPLALRTLAPALYGAALLGGLYRPGGGWSSWAAPAVIAFLCHFLWRIYQVVAGGQPTDTDRVEVGLLAVLALTTIFDLAPAFSANLPVDLTPSSPARAAAFGFLVLALSGAIALPGILALPLATVLAGPAGLSWLDALNSRLPNLLFLELLAAAAGTVLFAEKRRYRRLELKMEKLRLDAEHMGARADGIGAEKKGDLSRLDDVLYTYLQKVKEYAGAHTAVLATVKSPKGDLYIRELVSDSHNIREEGWISLDGSTFQWVVRNHKELRIGRLADAGRLGYYRGSIAVRSFLGVPLLQGEEVQGVLALDSLREEAFGEAHVTMLQVASHQVSTILDQTREFAQKKREARDFRALHDFSKRIVSCSSTPELLDLVLHSIRERVQTDFSAVALVGPEGGMAVNAVSSPDWTSLVGRSFAPEEGLAGWVLSSRQYLHYKEAAGRRPLFSKDVRLPDFQSLLVHPLESQGEALGALCLGSTSPGAFDSSAVDFCDIVSQQAALSLLHIQYVERLRQLAATDSLTGLANRRVFLDRLAEEFKRIRRYPQEMALLLLDVDHFKKINDRLGHPAGDEVLREIAAALRGFARETDLVARYGGEEFVLLLPGTEEAGAKAVAERIRAGIEGRKVAWEGKGIPVRVSLGVTVLEGEKDTPEAMVARADQSLYAAKETGRNRVITYSEIREYQSWK